MDHLVPWLTLQSVPGIGNLLFHRLVNHFGTPEKVLNAGVASLKGVDGISSRLAFAISSHRTPDRIFRDIEACRKKGFDIITQQDPAYPALLLQIPDPPPVLYCYGVLSGSACHIAVVGSRKATSYGKNSARHLCRGLASRGISVVSGMALGIDTSAHEGAIECGGQTVAVLGSGLERVYPAQNLKLFHRIADNGAVLSEFPLKTEPKAHHFPLRNRIISGMALGTVVVEAAQRSGSLITARLAAEQGREVYAVPGSIHAPTARGTHDLIKQGAKLVENELDIIEEVAPRIEVETAAALTAEKRRPRTTAVPRLTKQESQLLEAIGPYPVHIDELARRCRQQMGALNAALLQLELKGAVNQEPGKFFVRSHS